MIGRKVSEMRRFAVFNNGGYRVLVATDVAARGIHVDGIAHVVNFDLPQVPEDFIHRVGRTARAGGSGTASTFATRAQRAEIRKIEKALALTLTRTEVPQDRSRRENRRPEGRRPATTHSSAQRGFKAGTVAKGCSLTRILLAKDKGRP